MDVFYGKGVILSLIAVCGELMAAFGFPPENRTEGGFGGIPPYVCPSEREMYMDSSRYRTCRQIEKVWHMKIEWKKKNVKGKRPFQMFHLYHAGLSEDIKEYKKKTFKNILI